MSEHEAASTPDPDNLSGARFSKEDTEDQRTEPDEQTGRSTWSQSGTQLDNVDDVKKAITFTNSITDAIKDIVTPMREIHILAVQKDPDNIILTKAAQRLKEEFTENRVLSELQKMYDLYKSSLSDNSLLEAQCHELQEKVKQYEARHHWDPRVLKVLLIAERYRHEKALVYDEKNEIEAELIDMAIERKHLEDNLKNKNKDLQKYQDELKTAKELEKQVEYLEIVLMRKDNEIQTIQDSLDIFAQSQTPHKPESQHPKLSNFTVEDPRSTVAERDILGKIDTITLQKDSIKNELEEKNNLLKLQKKNNARIKKENAELMKLCKDQLKTIGRQESENIKLLNRFSAAEKKMAVMRDQLTESKSEIVGLKATLVGQIQTNANAYHILSAKRKESLKCQQDYSIALKKLSDVQEVKSKCKNDQKALIQESQAKDKDILHSQKQISEKTAENHRLVNRLFKVETAKNRFLELMKMTRINQSQMLTEISALRHSLQVGRAQITRDEADLVRMQSQIEALQREYLNVLEKNVLLVRNHEITAAAIEQYDHLKAMDGRKIAHLMKTNIDLYTQNTSQQEIALIQNHQFQLKENEIKGLLSRLEEEDNKMERMICKDNEKRNIIEQLHAEATSKEEKIKFLKSEIESNTQLNKSLSDKVEELSEQLRLTQTQKDLVRRQRDLFGTNLLQSQVETQLCQDKLRTARDTMSKYSVDFYNLQNDIRVLKLEIKNLRRKSKLSEGHADTIHTLQQELGQTCKALELQKCKNAILEKTKMPEPHRWRSLQASDPSRYEMVLKINLLIRRLIHKTKEVARLEELIKQKDTMYLALRVLVQRRMNTQFSSEMLNARAVIQKQNRQLKAMTAELNMAHDNAAQAKVREQESKKMLDDLVLPSARDRVATLGKQTKKDVSKFPLLPMLPSIHQQQTR